jgi:hypothetical protein
MGELPKDVQGGHVSTTESFQIVVVDVDDVDHANMLGKDHDVTVARVPVAGFEPVSTVALSIAGSAFAVATVIYLLDRHKGGQVIDLRPGAPKAIYRTTDVSYGYVIIVAIDGTVRVEVREPRGMFGQVSELITGIVAELMGNDVGSIADVVKDRIPDDVAEITVTQSQKTG